LATHPHSVAVICSGVCGSRVCGSPGLRPWSDFDGLPERLSRNLPAVCRKGKATAFRGRHTATALRKGDRNSGSVSGDTLSAATRRPFARAHKNAPGTVPRICSGDRHHSTNSKRREFRKWSQFPPRWHRLPACAQTVEVTDPSGLSPYTNADDSGAGAPGSTAVKKEEFKKEKLEKKNKNRLSDWKEEAHRLVQLWTVRCRLWTAFPIRANPYYL